MTLGLPRTMGAPRGSTAVASVAAVVGLALAAVILRRSGSERVASLAVVASGPAASSAATALASDAAPYYRFDSGLFTYRGRFRSSPNGTDFDAAGAEISFKLYGPAAKRVVVNITQPHVNRHFAESKFCVIINGAKMNETWSTLALNFSEAMSFEFVAPPGEANVTLFKNTEAVYGSLPSFRFDMRNYLRFHGVAVRSVESAKLLKTTRGDDDGRRKKIAVIGDSISAGDCNTCPEDEAPVVAAEEFYYAWPRLVCAAFDAHCEYQAWTALGVVDNWDSVGDMHQKDIYELQLASDWTSTDVDVSADFDAFAPDALLVNVGTDDAYRGYLENSSSFSRAYESLIDVAVTRSPSIADVFIMAGPISVNYYEDVDTVIDTFSLVEEAVADTVSRFSRRLGADRPDVAVHYLGLQRYNSSAYGHFCCGHPSIDKHKFMASSIATNISDNLGWNLITNPLDIAVIKSY